jgi:hypothetical protein
MIPRKFRLRYVRALPEVPAGMNLGLDEFYSFPESYLTAYALSQVDANFLCSVGLPKQASPFLSFTDYSEGIDIPEGYCPIGADGSGNHIFIERGSGNVVLLDHDFEMNRVFINGSLIQFAECLCLYQEHLTTESISHCFAAMREIDKALEAENSWWKNIITHG